MILLNLENLKGINDKFNSEDKPKIELISNYLKVLMNLQIKKFYQFHFYTLIIIR